jgi:mannose-6-phosphate isomerase-like protein (cupin superfamily)
MAFLPNLPAFILYAQPECETFERCAQARRQKVHAHQDADKIYVVLEGSGTFRIGSEEQELGPETVVLAPSGVEHGVENTGEVRLTLLVFMAPNLNVV